ncbi:MAG: DUF4065 domain-containing protein [Sphingobacteriales bacterium JAD_PAG50586_3]|nr:MAG: DUF4065 domain-containing protein [Sphingobacteriales bacterium JAD_PAG50586_3]
MAHLAVHIAAAFIKRATAEKKTLNKKKLQCLLYFAHGYSLALYNQPLLQQRFEVSKNGPVIHSVALVYRQLNSAHKNINYKVDFSSDVLHVILLAWNKANSLTEKAFVRLATQPGTPWANANAPQHSSLYIDDSAIKIYFEKWYITDVTLPTKTYRYILKNKPVNYLHIPLNALMCPCCKTSPCNVANAAMPAPVEKPKAHQYLTPAMPLLFAYGLVLFKPTLTMNKILFS